MFSLAMFNISSKAASEIVRLLANPECDSELRRASIEQSADAHDGAPCDGIVKVVRMWSHYEGL